jgi:hypothetical protein
MENALFLISWLFEYDVAIKDMLIFFDHLNLLDILELSHY